MNSRKDFLTAQGRTRARGHNAHVNTWKAHVARNRLVMENRGLVYRIAIKFAKRFPAWHSDELIADGIMALMRAIEGFDVDRGNQFSTYAYWSILRTLSKTVQTENIVKTPEWKCNLKVESSIVKARAKVLSGLDQDENAAKILGNIPVSPNQTEVDDREEIAFNVQRIMDAMKGESPVNRYILKCRVIDGKTLEETAASVAKRFGGTPVTKERIRQRFENFKQRIRENLNASGSGGGEVGNGGPAGEGGVPGVPESDSGDASDRREPGKASGVGGSNGIGRRRRAGSRGKSAA